MKKLTKWKLLLIILAATTTSFFSCQKEIAKDDTDNQIISKVNSWLDSKKPPNKDIQSTNVELLRSNLDFSKLRIEQNAQDEKIIVIPVKDGLKTEKNIDKDAIPSLVLIFDKSGNIRKGNLVLFIPESGQVYDKVPNNTFHNILNTGKPESNGKFSYLSLTGKRLHELEYHDGKLKSFSYLKDSSTNPTVRTNNCVDWYWVSTWYDDWGNILSQSWEYYGTTCQGQDCYDSYDAMLCPIDGSSGGSGGAPDEGYEFFVSKPFKLIVAQDIAWWRATSYETISGIKKASEQPCGGHFTSIVHENSYLDYGQNHSWTQIGNTVSVDDPCTCRAYTTGRLTVPSGQWSVHENSTYAFFELEFP